MIVIHKYPLKHGDTKLIMPRGAEVVYVATHQEQPTIWVRVDTRNEAASYEFGMYCDDQQLSETMRHAPHLGTFMDMCSDVYHVFGGLYSR